MNMPSFQTRACCPACGAEGRPVFKRPLAEAKLRAALTAFYAKVGALDYSPLEHADYAVSQCPSCFTWFQTQVPSNHILGRLYEEWIDPEKARLRFHHDTPPYQSLHIAREVMLALALTGRNAARVSLDYGCGWGEWGRMTQAFGWETWGTELSRTRCEHAEKVGIRIVDEADLPGRHFGLINLDQVLEHMPNPSACIGLLATKLHPHGILRLAVPNARRVAGALKNFDRELFRPRLGGLNAIAPLEHLNAFTQTGLLRLAANAGLVRVRPPWRTLLSTTFFPPGGRAKTKTLLRPFYLRSQQTTQLYFRLASAGH